MRFEFFDEIGSPVGMVDFVAAESEVSDFPVDFLLAALSENIFVQ